MKSLFNEDSTYTVIGTHLDDIISRSIDNFFEIAIEEGYSLRELSHLIHLAVFDRECSHILEQRTI